MKEVRESKGTTVRKGDAEKYLGRYDHWKRHSGDETLHSDVDRTWKQGKNDRMARIVQYHGDIGIGCLRTCPPEAS